MRRPYLANGGRLRSSRGIHNFVVLSATLMTLGSGVINLWSVAVPPLPDRMRVLHGLFPLEFLHISNFLDGGWRSLDQNVFARIGEHGFAVAGFSASEYLKAMGEVSDTTTPPKLAADFQRIIQFAEQSMNLPRLKRLS